MTPGIPTPVISHRFKLSFDNHDELSKHVLSARPDYFNKVISLIFREDVDGEVRAGMREIYFNGCQSLELTTFDGNNTPFYCDVFKSVSVVGHTAHYSYKENNAVGA